MFDTREREHVRRGLKVLVEETPLAPDFEMITAARLRPARRRSWSPHIVVTATAALAVGFAVLTVYLVGGQPDTDPGASSLDTVPTTRLALPALAPGEFPRLIIDQPGWTISHMEELEGESERGAYHVSTVVFTDGSTEADLLLSSGASTDLEALIADRLQSGTRLDDQTVLGSEAVVIRDDDSSALSAVWADNEVEYQFMTGDTDEETFRSMLQSLTRVSEDDWIGSLPDTIVSDRPSAVRQYLSDIPLPPGFDMTTVEEGPIESWYQVGADTVRAVACRWIEYWINAKAAGDQAAVQQAVDAMAGSHQWDILNRMSSQGAFHEVVYEYADAIATDGTVSAGYETPERLTVEESYVGAFGCNRR